MTEYTEQKAKEYVRKTILTGNKKRISEVLEHYRLAFGKKVPARPQGTLDMDTTEEKARKIGLIS